MVQRYAWGAVDGLAGQLAGVDGSCAELWFGAHPRGTARFASSGLPIPPVPFLLKILSVGCPLSIQAHPDSELGAAATRTGSQELPGCSAQAGAGHCRVAV